MQRNIRTGDECLSKSFGYGFVNEVAFGETIKLRRDNIAVVCFPVPEWTSTRVIKVIYNFEGNIIQFPPVSDLMDFKIKIDLDKKTDCVFYKHGTRYVMFEKKFCNV